MLYVMGECSYRDAEETEEEWEMQRRSSARSQHLRHPTPYTSKDMRVKSRETWVPILGV